VVRCAPAFALELSLTDAPLSQRIAAIDVGTNSIRLIVAEAFPDGTYRVLDDEKETTRLGQGLAATGAMSTLAMQQAVEALSRMQRIAQGFHVQRLRAIGTCAVREAVNRDFFLELVRDRAGLVIEPISPDEEARLAWLSAARAFPLNSQPAAVVDLGGGSVEALLSLAGVIERVYSLPLGAVRLTEEFGGPERCASDRFDAMCRAIRKRLQQEIGQPPFVPQLMIGTGGTFTSLANIALARSRSSGDGRPHAGVRGFEMNRSDVRHLRDYLRDLPLRTRGRVPGLSPDRSDIIVAGASVVERIMKYLHVNRLVIHDGGVRDGLLLTMVAQIYPPSREESPDRLRSVRQFAAACGYEERHANHVAKLAGQLFDQLAARLPGRWADPANRQILQAAALLCDIGYLINYSKHHRHSYHLIVHSDLAGFTPREIELIATVARYHRRAAPKKKHPEFGLLSRGEQQLVKRLAAILRIADGLDRQRMQNIRRVSLSIRKRTAFFRLEADDDPAIDAWGAVQKSWLFTKVFALKPQFSRQLRPAFSVETDHKVPAVH
jgi:exopolyphosphatase/guanosine-5'-triphosphate,3'-diphosphate pyrophosphatase